MKMGDEGAGVGVGVDAGAGVGVVDGDGYFDGEDDDVEDDGWIRTVLRLMMYGEDGG